MVIRERLTSFGPNEGLFGILSLPAGERRGPTVIIPNAGIVHRIGPHRLHVRLARFLAEAGHQVLRFDIHGLGDSAAPSHMLNYEEQANADLSAAIDASGTDEVTVLGLCSGADNAMRSALSDQRITGLVLMDPHAYCSPKVQAARLAAKALDPGRWQRAAGRLFNSSPTEVLTIESADNDRVAPPREQFGAEMESLTARGVNILIRYTQFVADTVTEASHFYGAFPDVDFQGRVTVDVDLETDHTYSSRASQERLKKRIAEWLSAPVDMAEANVT